MGLPAPKDTGSNSLKVGLAFEGCKWSMALPFRPVGIYKLSSFRIACDKDQQWRALRLKIVS